MKICLTRMKSPTRSGYTHAYFPALATCCATLEYLSGLRRGNVIDSVGYDQISHFSDRHLPQPDYDRETIRILFLAFRNSVAHRGISTGVWVDRQPGPGRGRRLTWKVLANSRHPAVRIRNEKGKLTKDPPEDCEYTHRVYIHLRDLWIDIRGAVHSYREELVDSRRLLNRFDDCMTQLYPT